MAKTRSQTKKEQELNRLSVKEEIITPSNISSASRPLPFPLIKPLYEVNIDFDEASKAWHANKKSIGNGQYKYICTVEKNGIKCGKSCYKDLSYCWIHRNSCK